MNSVVPGFGRGIYAGKNYHKDEIVEISPSLLIKNTFAMENQLQYFVYATDDEAYDGIVFGEGMMYNSLDNENLVHEWADEVLPGFDSLYDQPFTNYTFFKYVTEQNIRAGEEFFVDYGTAWFSQRNQKPITSSSDIVKRRYSLKDMQEHGFCLSDSYISQSSIPMAGRGLFAKKYYRKGETVMISPVLVLPKEDIQTTIDSSVLINYCISSNQSNVALLPISVGGLINHDGISANVELMWDTDTNTRDHLSWSTDQLASLNYAPLSVKYVAKRPIMINEEITLSYGEIWEREWLTYLTSLQEWSKKYLGNGHFMKPQFRQMIEAPKGMFPTSFYNHCFAKRCQSDTLLETLKAQDDQLILDSFEYAKEKFIVKSMHECSASDNICGEVDTFENKGG